jgi:small subunit ribosomal protein S17
MSDETVNSASADAEALDEQMSVEADSPDTDVPVAAEPESSPEAEASEPMAAEADTPADDTVTEAPADDTEQAPPSVSAKRKRKRLPRPLRRQRTKAKREKPAERKPITRLPKPEHARGRRQERQGMVVSASADKTIVVRVDVAKVHPIYKKVVKRSSRFHAHDEENRAKVGDVVRIVETRPLSRLKRWRLQEIVEAAK